MRYLIASLFLIAIIFGSCEKDSTSSKPKTTGNSKLTIYLTDAPSIAQFDSINIKFSHVSAHFDSEWITVQDTPITVNMLDLINGNVIVFGSNDVPAGKYTQIRIIIDDAWVVVDGIRKPLDVPSGAQTGLKLGPEFTVAEGITYELVVDFDVNRSIVVTGPPSNPGYKLKPHLRVIPMAISGSISGNVVNHDDFPVAYAIQNSDTITSTIASPINGFFKLAFLPAGLYEVSIRDTLDQSSNIDSVEVIVGSDTDLGGIMLF